jgi:hypothetical protein
MSDTPRPVPTPAALRPPRPAATPATGSPVSASADAMAFGRVTEDGTVFLRAPEGEVRVGQWTVGSPEEGLAFFARKYDDLAVELELAAKRLADGRSTAEQAHAVVTKVREGLAARSFVGDVEALDAACTALDGQISAARAQQQAAKAEQRAAALAKREALVAEAEQLRDSNAWKSTTERFAAIVEEWKGLPRADRGAEQELWKRLSAARTHFDKQRRAHYAVLEASRKTALGAKRDLIARAEALTTSTDWQGTPRKLRDLMAEWKAAPRGSRTDEDRLWKRFKAAQDAFFAAKTAHEIALEEELTPNVPLKEALVVEAEGLLPVTDTKAAKRALRSIQDRWDKVGEIPRKERDRLEARLRKVEDALRSSEADAWKASTGTVATDAFSAALERLQEKRDAAQARGDAKVAADLDAQIAATRALMGS